MFVATFYGGHLDGAIYECDSCRPVADAIVMDAGMMEVVVTSPGSEFNHHVPSAESMTHFLEAWDGGFVKIGDPSATDSMLVKVEVR